MSPDRVALRYDDLASLKQREGEPWSPYGPTRSVSQEMINQFAALTGDEQWIHVDVARAQSESPLRTTIAHGFLVLSLLPLLRQRTDLSIVGHGSALNYGADKLRFLTPVPAGAKVWARARIREVAQKPRGTLITEEIEVGLADPPADKPVLSYTMLVLYLP